MIVLGINGINDLFHDASATLICDNELIASVEEERFNRRKHSNGIPYQAIQYCLKKAGVSFADVDHIGYYLDPEVLRKTFVEDVVHKYECHAASLQYYVDASARIARVRDTLAESFPYSRKTKFSYLNHHLAHASSAYYISGFDDAAVLTIDGSGDRESAALYHGCGRHLTKVHDFLIYPESIGFIYTVFAKHLGFEWVEGPGKLMGLAGYGTADSSVFEDVVRLQDDAFQPIQIDLSFFDYHTGGSGLSKKGTRRFGMPRRADQPAEERHANLAASVQLMLEMAIIHIVSKIPALLPQARNLCFAGGVALNVNANRRIMDTGLFTGFFVPPPASDAGTSLGCALYLNTVMTQFHRYRFNVYCGPDIAEDFDIPSALAKYHDRIMWEELTEAKLCQRAAEYVRDNKIIGWAQGRMECGPRALGNRSILTNAMNPRAKDDLNTRVKKREAFRPYAPAILLEECDKWFDIAGSRYMLLEARVRPEKRTAVPGIVHVDGTSRPQSVARQDNPRFYTLIRRFFEITGVPLILNTSFNMHGEPIVNTPDDAIVDLLTTDMDALFLGNFHVVKRHRAGN